MLLHTVTINGRTTEYLSEDEFHIEEKLHDLILEDEIYDFYNNSKIFIEDQVQFKTEEARKKLWLINTDQSGWDTYDSGVFCAYTEKQALDFSIDRMGNAYEDNTADVIGLAIASLEIGEVVSSFNAG